jgi:hypothetical protein
MVTIVYQGRLHVHYAQAYVLSAGCDMLRPEDAFAGQANGLCGAAVNDGIFLTTGLHTGYVNLVVSVFESAPEVDMSWDEIVESPWRVRTAPAHLEDWNGEFVCEIPLPAGTYRIRYCANNFGQAPEGNGEEEENCVESYMLSFWPSAIVPDSVVKQTSEHAAYWNGAAWPTMRKN